MIYVLHVHTGKELEIRRDIEVCGQAVLLPQEEREEHRKGQWQNIKRILMPGYVFVDIPDMDAAIYYKLRAVRNVIRFLGGNHPQGLPADEDSYIRILDNGGVPLQPSRITLAKEIISGPLTYTGIEVIKINMRQRRATAVVNVLGQPKEITLSVIVSPLID